jgi:DNA-binding transcriptional ArsR family regulator
MSKFDQEAKLFKVLMHPARLEILDILREGEECVCHMEAFLGYRQAYISQQLMVLRESGLVADRRDGWNIFYYVTKPEVYTLVDAASRMIGVPQKKYDHNTASCPCPKCNTEVNVVQSIKEISSVT